MKTFSTFKEALSEGYTRGSAHLIHRHRGIPVYSVDVSGPNLRDYAYEIQLLGKTYAYPELLWFTDQTNEQGTKGCHRLMYAPGVRTNVIVNSMEIINAYLKKNPDQRPYRELVEEAKRQGDIGRMYSALCKAATNGHPGVRKKGKKDVPRFTDPLAWTKQGKQLSYFSEYEANQQMEICGISWR